MDNAIIFLLGRKELFPKGLLFPLIRIKIKDATLVPIKYTACPARSNNAEYRCIMATISRQISLPEVLYFISQGGYGICKASNRLDKSALQQFYRL